MRRHLLIACAVLALVGPAVAAPPGFGVLTVHGSVVQAGGYRLDLGEADDPVHPQAWQGPIQITASDGHSCTVSDDVAIVSPPLLLTHGSLLYVNTYSGSTNRLFVVDARNCDIKWISPGFAGTPHVAGDTLYLPDVTTVTISPSGVPVTK